MGECAESGSERSASSSSKASPIVREAAAAARACVGPEVALGGVSLRLGGCLAARALLITGATGFVGSVVLEQLLRLYPDGGRIFLLIRAKRGQSADARLQQLLTTKALFRPLLVDGAVPPALAARLVAVPGDTTLPGLGLSEGDRARLTAEVSWVVHSAASISFFEHIHVLLSQNYDATRRVADLARQCTSLRGFVHVSTAYVNSHLPRGSHIEEAIYPLQRASGEAVAHAQLAARLAALPAARAEKEAQALLGEVGLPNSYTLTKHMCEDLLADLHSPAFPVAIVRPSIIGALAGAPLPGYFGNAAGLTSATLAFATGMARYTCHNPFSIYDVIPCDVVGYVILGALPALQQEAVQRQPALVLHACSSTSNPLVFAESMRRVVIPYWSQVPPKHRLSSKPYKPLEAKNAWVDYDSLTFKMLTAKANMRMTRIELLLRLLGKKKVADLIKSSWKVWKLYNTPTMDFELYFCCKSAEALAGALEPGEAAEKGLKLVWSKEDDWWSYIYTHQAAIRAKYYPDTVEAAKAFHYVDRPLTEEERLQHVVLRARGPAGRGRIFRQAHTVPGARSPPSNPSPQSPHTPDAAGKPGADLKAPLSPVQGPDLGPHRVSARA